MHEDIIPTAEQRWVGRFVRATMFRRRTGNGWKVPPGLEHQSITFAGNNGARLAGLHFPHPDPRGIVVLAHPDRRYGQYWFAREGWIEWLHDNGYAVLSFDFVQYGRSRGGSTYLYQDVIQAARTARDIAPGVPVHVVGLSLGAFATAVASPDLDFVESMTLESPYPDFGSWYGADGSRFAQASMRAFGAMFPRTGAYIRADRRIADAAPARILVVASKGDDVTPVNLSRRVMSAAPPDRLDYLEFDDGDHLCFFREKPEYREALLAHLSG